MDRKIEKYGVFVGEKRGDEGSKKDLETQVLALLAAGWELQGGVSITCGPSDRGSTPFIYAQAMIKYW